MITNIAYLKTAIECLEQGQSPMTEAKILGTIKFICEQNIQRIELDLVDQVDSKIERGFQDLQNQRLVDNLRD
jgi:hypothetical protein